MTNILDGTPSVSSFLGSTKSQKIISEKCDHLVSENTKSQKKPFFSDQRSYISNMELALFKCLFWKANDSLICKVNDFNFKWRLLVKRTLLLKYVKL